MTMTLVLAFVLLVVMAFLALRPFLVASESFVGPGGPAAGLEHSAVSDTSAPVDHVAVTVPSAPDAASSAQLDSATSTVDVRASVEAAIAARKAAMLRHACTGCGRTVEAEDHFCRGCGRPVEVAEKP